MNDDEKQKIRKAVDSLIIENKFDQTSYRDWFRLIKSLNFGHRPTHEETQEVLFYGICVMKGREIGGTWIEGKEFFDKKLGVQ